MLAFTARLIVIAAAAAAAAAKKMLRLANMENYRQRTRFPFGGNDAAKTTTHNWSSIYYRYDHQIAV
jgi:hypothetical protein